METISLTNRLLSVQRETKVKPCEAGFPFVLKRLPPGPAVSLATSTLVRLLPEFSIIHNHKYFVLCIDVTFLRRGRTVFTSPR
jgi:hypothetical protein